MKAVLNKARGNEEWENNKNINGVLRSWKKIIPNVRVVYHTKFISFFPYLFKCYD